MALIGHAHSSEFMEWRNLGITRLKHAMCAPNIFLKMPENQITNNFIYLISSNFVTKSQANSLKHLWKFWNGPLHLLNVTAYWKISTTEDCAKKLSQILANNINNVGIQGLVTTFM